MTQFAYFDPTITPISPVIGWYDTVALNYPNLPSSNSLLELSETQWEKRMTQSWGVQNGSLVFYTQPTPVLTLSQQAELALLNPVYITFTNYPELTGSYSINSQMTANVGFIVAYLGVNNGSFPNNKSYYMWPDNNPNVPPHKFPSASVFLAFATALTDYISNLDQIVLGEDNLLPTPDFTIDVA